MYRCIGHRCVDVYYCLSIACIPPPPLTHIHTRHTIHTLSYSTTLYHTLSHSPHSPHYTSSNVFTPILSYTSHHHPSLHYTSHHHPSYRRYIAGYRYSSKYQLQSSDEAPATHPTCAAVSKHQDAAVPTGGRGRLFQPFLNERANGRW